MHCWTHCKTSMPLLETQEGWMLNDPEQNMELKKDFNSAICVQKVDAHMSCSSHSDAQLAAFFIDPRAKWSTVECYIHLVASISAYKRKHSTTVFTAQTGVSTKPKKPGVGTYAVQKINSLSPNWVMRALHLKTLATGSKGHHWDTDITLICV